MNQQLLLLYKEMVKTEETTVFSELLEPSISITAATFLDLVFSLNAQSSHVRCKGKAITDFTAIYIRQFAGNLEYYQALVALLPDLPLIQGLKPGGVMNKFWQYCSFARERLPFPKTVFSLTHDPLLLLSAVQQEIAFPVVAKSVKGSLGKGSFLLHQDPDLTAFITKKASRKRQYIYQEYIPNDYDYRLTVMGNHVISILKKIRQTPGEWRNNGALGGQIISLPPDALPSNLHVLAIKAVQALGLAMGGVDVVLHKNTQEPYILEVNESPNLVAGTKVAVMDYLNRKLSTL